MAADQLAAQAVDQAFWQNVGVAVAGGVAVVGAILMGVKRYLRQWKDETAASNASSAGVVATEAMNLVVEMLRRELQQMADLYREVNEHRVELLGKVEQLEEQIGKLQREIAELRRVDEENSRLRGDNQTLQTQVRELEHVLASCCRRGQCLSQEQDVTVAVKDATLYGPGGRPAPGTVASTDQN